MEMSVFELLAIAREMAGADYVKGDRIRCEKGMPRIRTTCWNSGYWADRSLMEIRETTAACF